ncbi:MAG: hypothetical protein V4598_04540 [Bdellovibrionota bacterium]
MSKTLTFYFPLKVPELDALVAAFQKEFDELINDTFSEDEMELVEKKLDALAAVYVGPLLSELSFDDFESEEAHRDFFNSCKSSLLLENVPYLETNPFQVSWLQMFLGRFSDFLVDKGNLTNLLPKESFLNELTRYKNMDGLIQVEKPKAPALAHGVKAPVLPIDFLILDVYKELERIRANGMILVALEKVAEMDKVRRLFVLMKEGKLDAHSLLSLSGLIPKDFDDNLEKLKFLLRKI